MRRLIVTCDDVGATIGGIEACKKCVVAGTLTSGSVIINSESRLLVKVGEELTSLSLGLHLNVFDGIYENDKLRLFGEKGLFGGLLRMAEYSKKTVSLSLEEKMALRDEFKRQVEAFSRFFGCLPSHLSYHYGLHFVDDFYQEYWHVAEGYGLPFRFAPQYTRLKPGYKNHPDLFLDSLNNRMIEEREVLGLVETVVDGQTAELCVHLDDGEAYKRRQVEIFSQKDLKLKLAKLGVSLVGWGS